MEKKEKESYLYSLPEHIKAIQSFYRQHRSLQQLKLNLCMYLGDQTLKHSSNGEEFRSSGFIANR